MEIHNHFQASNEVTLFEGDCYDLLGKMPDNSVDIIITSPPYCMKKAYEDPKDDVKTFEEFHRKIFGELYRVLKPGGSICWQIGYHVTSNAVIPLDYIVYSVFTERNETLRYPLVLRNRIIWTFGHGLNSTQRFSGRHEMILWFTKGNKYNFDLDSVRVPQKYPGKRYYKGSHKGELSGNPLGKNPSDIWDIPNVKANHVEKTEHPCQFPAAIPQRLIRALTKPNDVVLDPFMGSGTTAIAAIVEKRRFVGAEIYSKYYSICTKRVTDAISGVIKIRDDTPVMVPNQNSAVATLPDEFRVLRENTYGTEDKETETPH